MTKSETPSNLPIFTKRKKNTLRNKKARENYHIYRALGKIPKRYSQDSHDTDEHRAASRNQRKARWSDPKHQQNIAHQNMCYYQRKHNLLKQCSECLIIKEHAKFDRQHTNKYQLRSYCKDCRKIMNAKAYQQRKSNNEPNTIQLRCPRTGQFRHNQHRPVHQTQEVQTTQRKGTTPWEKSENIRNQ